jgi:UDP-N-acetyl-2-amino-2-deoxyglucuronate dehydrogenase
MSNRYRIAIIGVGAIADMHARAIGDLSNAELVAGSCRTEARGRKFVEQFGGVWYAGYEKMLDEQKPDLVSICMPSGAHLEPTLACAARRIHVLCEKPLEITTKRVDEMIRAADSAGIVLGGIFPSRFNPVVQAVQAAAAAGRFGDLSVASTYVPWWRDDAYYSPDRWQGTMALDGGGALMNQSIHGVDMLQWIVGSTIAGLEKAQNPVEQVFAFTGQRGHDPGLIEVEDTAVAVLRFRDGGLGQVLGATSMYPGTFKRFAMGGRDGTTQILEDQLITFQFRADDPKDDEIRRRFGQETTTGGGASDPMAIDYSNHTHNIAAFLDALDRGERPLLDGLESRKAVAIIEAMYTSAREGRAVDVV